jgi:hypothetical protein
LGSTISMVPIAQKARDFSGTTTSRPCIDTNKSLSSSLRWIADTLYPSTHDFATLWHYFASRLSPIPPAALYKTARSTGPSTFPRRPISNSARLVGTERKRIVQICSRFDQPITDMQGMECPCSNATCWLFCLHSSFCW